MEELYEKGLCRSIGVSNFLISHLEQLKEDCVITPHVNQVEYHPFQRPQELVDYCRSRDIVFEGYCPLAKGEALTYPSIIQLAKKYGRTPAQICIRWSIQNGIVTIPKSTKAERIEENCKVFDFAIAEDDVEVLNGMHDGRHVSWDPSLVVQFQSRVLKGPAYTLDFCGVFHRKTSFLNTSCGQWGGTEERVPVLLVGMEYNPGVKHLTKHSPAYFW
ncbi:sphingosine 1-phosphate receptor 1 isoform X11 [Strigops habroptila]|nr:sphingosine 1-phosphate receptor 1 isoform X11 [Strigops habroptila]